MMDNSLLKKIQLLLMDVDGVLTTGQIIYDDDGREIKIFHVRDGLGIRLLIDAGITVGIITGRRSKALVHRCRNLGIDLLKDGISDKAAALMEILSETGIPAEHTAFVGDDLPDLPILRRVGVPIAVADSHEAVRSAASWITQSMGGKGAVREIAERLLAARGDWQTLLEKRFS
ncbi:HAD hydrolase family protein [Desulfosarcina sp. OttesenSCG-928-A07]|nr:HAD hydrolase family protein [Desulfosarcina sp. OttesenSCG-928-G17]MDL2329542.1 HAD hydrolase family protein [Desulfosarcina sp. OttesenSCG-928-A07]